MMFFLRFPKAQRNSKCRFGRLGLCLCGFCIFIATQDLNRTDDDDDIRHVAAGIVVSSSGFRGNALWKHHPEFFCACAVSQDNLHLPNPDKLHPSTRCTPTFLP